MIIIDTNVYSALDNGFQSAIDVLSGQDGICLPVLVVGELQYGFLNGSKQKENEARLSMFLAQDKIDVLYLTINTAKIYGQLALCCKQVGKALSHNDLWIAAIAMEADATFATYDKDFEVFSDMFGDKLIILDN